MIWRNCSQLIHRAVFAAKFICVVASLYDTGGENRKHRVFIEVVSIVMWPAVLPKNEKGSFPLFNLASI